MNLENGSHSETLPVAALPPANGDTPVVTMQPCNECYPSDFRFHGNRHAVIREGGCPPPSDPCAGLGSPLPAPSSLAPVPNEPPQAFEAFLVYLKMTGNRRMINVAKATGASLRSLSRWAAEYDWVDRVNRWRAAQLQAQMDASLCQQAEANLAWSDRSASVREREWEITDDLLQALHRRLQSADLDDNSLARLARALAQVSKIARLSTGLAARPLDDSPGADPREAEFEAALQTAFGQLSTTASMSTEPGVGNQPPVVGASPK